MKKSSVLELKINGNTIIKEDTEDFIERFSSSLIEKHNKQMTKRSVYITTLNIIYKIFLVMVVVKFFPEFLTLLSK